MEHTNRLRGILALWIAMISIAIGMRLTYQLHDLKKQENQLATPALTKEKK